MKHTEGPWKLTDRSTDFAIKTKNGCVIALVYKFDGGMMQEEAKPNAELIKKAPELAQTNSEMLVALTRCEKVMRELAYKAGLLEEEVLDGDEFDKLRTLIAKTHANRII